MKALPIFALLFNFVFLNPSFGFSKEKPKLLWAISNTDTLPKPLQKILTTDKSFPVQLLMKKMPEYNHQVIYGNVLRIEQALKQDQLTCYPGSSSSEKRSAFTYSTVMSISPALNIILRKKVAEKFEGKDHIISLKKLLADKKIRGMVVDQRAFGPQIDGLLADSGIGKSISGPFAVNIIKMIQIDRVDFTIEYGFILKSLQGAEDVSDELVALPIEEAQETSKLYIACSKTDEGMAVIKKANAIIKENIKSKEYKDFLMMQAPESDSKNYQKVVDQFVKERSKTDMIY